MNTTVPGDVVVNTDQKKIAFEIETGANLRQYGRVQIEQKFRQTKELYDDFYIIVADSDDRKKYAKYGKTISRTEIDQVIQRINY